MLSDRNRALMELAYASTGHDRVDLDDTAYCFTEAHLNRLLDAARADSPPPTEDEIEAVAKSAALERICIGLFAEYDDMSLKDAEWNWRAGYGYGAVGSDAHAEIMATAQLILTSLSRSTKEGSRG